MFESLKMAGASGYRGADALHDTGQDGEFQVRIFEYLNDTYINYCIVKRDIQTTDA